MKPIRLIKTAPIAALFSLLGLVAPTEAQSPSPTIPPADPLTLQDGARVTSAAQWLTQRRPELMHLFEENMFGKTLAGKPDKLRFILREEKKDARNGTATRLRIGVLFEGTETGRQMELLVYLPNAVKGPVPLFLGLNFDGNFTTTAEKDLPVPTHYVLGLFLKTKLPDHRATEALRGKDVTMWPYDAILARGYGIATACYGEIEPDQPDQWWHGPRVFGPPTAGDSWGEIGAWSWALSRALDYLETNPRVDPRRVAVFGFSRLGKTAMWAGAQDQRFAAVISMESGKGGVSLMKRLVGEPVSHLAGPDIGFWFAPNFAKYSDNEAALPIDGSDLAALIAPRPLFILSGTKSARSDPEGEFLGGLEASPVYNLLGAEGMGVSTWPPAQKLINSNVGYYLRPGSHNVTPEDWSAILDWSDSHLKPLPKSPPS